MDEQVNIDVVLCLEEQSDLTLLMRQIEIPKSTAIIEELETMQEDPNRNLYDMSTYFYNNFNPIRECYNYCYPNEYNKVYLNEAVSNAPTNIPYWDYKDIQQKRYELWQRRNSYILKNLSIQEQEQKWRQHVHKLEYTEKKKYFSIAKKYIECQNLYLAMKDAKDNPHVKVFSHDTVGRKHFLYDINDDLKIDVFTNFGYGHSSCFFLTIKYKDIILIPYSDLVHYYYANMKSLVANTRSYRSRRDSWTGMMEYLSNFVNNSRHDPECFVREYVLKEIHEMMNGLREILKDPAEVLKFMRNTTETVRLSVVRSFGSSDFAMYEVYSNELTTIFKVEKISGALTFIESLKSLKDVCIEVDDVIKEIIAMNKIVAPEIPPVIESITNSILPLQIELEKFKKEKARLTSEEERYEKRLNRKLSFHKSFKEQDECTKKFKVENPRYVEVQKEINNLLNVIFELEQKIKKRQSLLNRITECNKRIQQLVPQQ